MPKKYDHWKWEEENFPNVIPMTEEFASLARLSPAKAKVAADDIGYQTHAKSQDVLAIGIHFLNRIDQLPELDYMSVARVVTATADEVRSRTLMSAHDEPVWNNNLVVSAAMAEILRRYRRRAFKLL